MEHLQAADEGILYWCENHHSSVGNAVMELGTLLGERAVVIGVLGAVLFLFWLAGQRRAALILLLASLLGIGISESTKRLIQRERPDVAWKLIERPHSPSFPSGHALNTTTLYGGLALLVSRRLRRRLVCTLVLLVGFALPLLSGISRPYLGVHYPSDVLAGWTAGLACALLALWADQRWGEQRTDRVSRPVDPPAS
jgi:undecaprenyl-diphosphatase